MKKLIALVAAGLLCGATFATAQDVDLAALKAQIAELQTKVDAMSKDMTKMQQHTVTDKVSLGVEFMTKLDSTQYKDVRGLPAFASDMMSLWLSDSLAQKTGTSSTSNSTWDTAIVSGSNTDGWNDAFMNKYANDFGKVLQDPNIVSKLNNMGSSNYMDTFASMLSSREVPAQYLDALKTTFNAIKPRKYDTNNDYMLTERLRVRMSSKVNENVSFTGRLVMYKTFGDTTPFHFFNGTMGSMNMDANSAQMPTDDGIHVERAYFVYANNIGSVPYHFSLGRRPAAYGAGMENHENAVLGGSPIASIIQMNFDGGSLGFDLEELTGIPGLNLKFCYGQGFEGQYGTLNSLNAVNDVNDVHFRGFILKAFDNDKYKVWYNYANGLGLTDGFIGTVVLPFYITGNDYNLDGKYDTYTLNPNYGGFVSRVEPMSKVGDIQLHTVMVQGNTFGFNWFGSYSMSKTDPSGSSKNPMYQFMGQDKMFDGTGHMVWLGVMTPELPFTKGKLGVEYNHGSKYWQPFMLTTDSMKLATRGDVYEVYYHQPIVGDNFFATIGMMYQDYKYTNSGSFLGEPVEIDKATAFNTMMPVVDKVTNYYMKLTYRY